MEDKGDGIDGDVFTKQFTGKFYKEEDGAASVREQGENL